MYLLQNFQILFSISGNLIDCLHEYGASNSTLELATSVFHLGELRGDRTARASYELVFVKNRMLQDLHELTSLKRQAFCKA